MTSGDFRMGRLAPPFFLTCLAVASLLIAPGCAATHYTSQYFSYPPGSVPHPDDPDGRPRGELIGCCTWSDDRSGRPGTNSVTMRIESANGTELLNDTFSASGYSPKAQAEWTDRDVLTVTFSGHSEPTPYASDAERTEVTRVRYLRDEGTGRYRRDD